MDERPRSRPAEQRRFNRRRLMQGTGLSGVGLAGLAVACSTGRKSPAAAGPSNAPANTASAQPKRGGSLNYAGGPAGSYDTLGRSFDPAIQTQFSAKGYTLFYERLLAYNLRTYAVEPELAQKWEQVSQTEYLFHLQPNVKWQNKPPLNGRPLTVDDILYNLERNRANDPRLYGRSLLSLLDKVEAPDTTTIRITTKEPDASTLTKLSVENLAILAHEILEKNPKPTTAALAVGTGAFMMTSVEENVGAEYTRNPTYWKPGLPYLDGFRTRHFADKQTAWAAFLANQLDLAIVPAPEIKAYVAQRGGGEPDWFADDTISLIYPNTRVKPMDDARVGHALRLLIDHDELINAWAVANYGKAQYGSAFPTALSDWDLTQDEYKQQLEWKQPKDQAAKEAVTLLNGAGFTKDSPLRFDITTESYNPAEIAAAQLLQAQWKRWSGGIVDAQLKPIDAASIDQARANHTFTFAHLGHSTGMVDPDIWLSSTFHSTGSLNFAGYHDPQSDALIDKQRRIFDEAPRKAAVKDVLRYLVDHCPAVIGANLYILQGVKPKIQGLAPEYYLNGRQYQAVWLNT